MGQELDDHARLRLRTLFERGAGDASAANRRPASLSGIVSDRPVHSGPRPATRLDSSLSAHSIAV